MIEELLKLKCPFRCGECPNTATWLMPSAPPAEEASPHDITFTPCCDDCRGGWWDGATWDGRHLEIDLRLLYRTLRALENTLYWLRTGTLLDGTEITRKQVADGLWETGKELICTLEEV